MKKFLLFLMLLVTSIASWAADPYFEVISGSFSSGNVTVKFTFPEATTVSVTGSIFLEHSDKPNGVYVTASGSAVSTEGNTVTAIFTYTPWAGIGEKGFSFWSDGITATGYSTYQDIFEPPYAEVMTGSIGSGNVTVQVTVPRATSVNFYPTSYPQFYYVALRHNGTEIAKLNLDNPNLSIAGNTVSAVFSYTATGDASLANYDVYFNQYCLQFDGQWNDNDVTAPFKGSSSDPEPGGDDDGDDDDDDPVVKPYIAGAFSVSGDKQVQFTKGNLYWNGSDWAIEDNQNTTTTTWNTNHISHFFWEPTADEARVEFNATPIHEFNEHLFCDGSDAEHMISLEGKADYYALSNDEYMYMLYSRPNSANLYKCPVTVDGVNFCLVIAPDNFTGSIADTYTLDALNEAGLVCLPPTGCRTYNWIDSETQFVSQNNIFYWSSTIDGSGNKYFLCPSMSMQDEYETRNAYAIRLVRDYAEESGPVSCSHVMNEMTAKCTYLYSTYYACEVCGHLFADAAGETEISEADVMHSFDGVNEMCGHGCGKHDPTMCIHSYEYHNTVVATCTEDGMFEHYACPYCDALFDNSLNPTTIEYLKLSATGHAMNYYKVCSNCGLEGEGAMHCYHTSLTPLGDNRTSCTQTTDYAEYHHCENCERYLSFEDGLYTSILKSDIQYTPGSQLHHNHLMVYNPGALCTQTSYSINFKECTDCRRKYFSFADDDLCTIVSDFELSDSYLDTKMSSPVGHNFENGSHVCSRCGFDAVYRQATVDSEIKPGAHYILVSKIGDQYYAFGKPGKEDRWYMGYLGFDAVPVNMEADGRIAVTSNDVMTLYTYGYLEAPYDGGQLQKDGTRSRTYDLSFYNPVYGSIYHNNTEDDIIEKNKYVVLDQTTSWFINETEAMNVHISNGEKRFYGYENILFRVDDERFPQYGSQLIEQGALVYSMPDWSGSPYQGFHAMYLGQNNGQEPRFHVPGFVRYHYPYTEPTYETMYPVYLYLLDTKKFINAENTTAANVSGPVTKADVMSIFTKAKESYDVNVAQLEADKQRYPDAYADYKVLKSSYQFTTIDLSKARISDGDLTYDDIIAMKNNEFSAPNVIIVLPETSGASAAKGMAPMKASSSLASIPNVIINGACETLELQDKQTMNVPTDFTAGNVSYSRSGVSSTWGTLCLPYAISSDENVQLYKLTAVDNSNAEGVMTFTPIAEAAAGQPVVFKKLDGEATTLSFDKENAELTIAGFNGESTDISKWELVGTYEQAKIKSDNEFGRYYIAQNKFWNAKVEATVPAFRAWFENDKSNDAAIKTAYTIFITDEDENITAVLNQAAEGELEECTEIYDLFGHKLERVVRGKVNIINGKKIYVK